MKKLLVLLMVLMLVALPTGFAAAQDNLTIYFLDVGQADAAILQCGDDVMMIDGGNNSDSSFVYSYLTKTLGIQHIDYMIATHPHEDHIGGLSGALNACSVGTIYSPITKYDSDTFSSLVKYANQQGLELTLPSVGETLSLGSASVQFLSPAENYSNVNDLSICVRIVHGNNSFLFAGDAEWDAEHAMVDSGYDLSADVLKVGHHGSDTSSSYVFLRDVMPSYGIISVGEGNSYDHPSDAALSRLRDAGTTVFRTDLQGTIVCVSDGNTLTFNTEKNARSADLWQGADTTISAAPAEDYSAAVPEDGDAPYIGNRNTKKFHYADCSSVDAMNEENKVDFYSRDEAINDGYVPCKRCDP